MSATTSNDDRGDRPRRTPPWPRAAAANGGRPPRPAANHRGRRPRGQRDSLTLNDLDDLDLRIIELLQENGRRSNVAMAQQLGVAEATVRHRIERLLADGFIRIAAVINPRRTNYQVDALIAIRVERHRALPVGDWLARFPNVVYVGYTTGRHDLLVEALFESDEELFEFLTEKLSIPRGITQTETSHVLRTVKINYDWRLPLRRRSPGRHGRR